MTPKQKRAIIVRQIDTAITKFEKSLQKWREKGVNAAVFWIHSKNLAADAQNIAIKAAELARHDAEHCDA